MEAHHINPQTGEDEFAYAEAPGGVSAGPGTVVRERRGQAMPAKAVDANDPSSWGKVSRNAPCPCGSGKKFKYCHGQEAATA